MTVSEKPWTPEMKLRSSATDEQIKERWLELDRFYDRPHDRGTHPSIAVARELASAVSLEKEAELAKWRNLAADFCLSHLGSSTVTTPEAFHKTQSQVALSWRRVMGAQRKELDEKDAEIARLRRDAERLDWLEKRCVQLDVKWDDDTDPYTVHEIQGNVNDRVWVKVGEGNSYRAAIDSAREAK